MEKALEAEREETRRLQEKDECRKGQDESEK